MKFEMIKLAAFATLLLAVFQPNFAQNIPKTMLRLPDTGQTQSFTDTPGEDSDFEQNLPFFILNGDGTVTDTVTGLMWQQSDGGEMTIEAATSYCQNLALGAYDDWRLPTAQEAFSILNHGKQNPPLDTAVFPDSGAEYWWTGERQAGNAAKVWVTNAGGGIGNHPKDETLSAGGTKRFHVRAVREVAPPGLLAEQFSKTFATTTDLLTGLEWQQFVNPIIQDSMTWEDALMFAGNLVLAGKSDWRMPNIKELQSLNDETRSQPSINTAAFPGIGVRTYWSSTSLPSQPQEAWFMDTRFGVVSHELKTAKKYLICVRGHSGATSAVSSVSGADFRVYPNPFTSEIWVEDTAENGFENHPPSDFFQLLDGFGRLVFSGENIVGKDFSELPPGLYFLKINGDKKAMLRLLKI